MKTFHIQKPDEAIKEALIDKINNLTKPKGSLGRLEEIALQIGLIQQSLSPRLTHPQNIIFAADHGIVEEKVSPSPKEVTWQQISNFLHGGAGINFLCRQHGFTLKIVDAGVDYDLPYEKGIINMKVGRGTRNFLHEAAMTPEEMELCLEHGAQCVDTSHQEGCNIISFGEMGIGNTTTSSAVASVLLDRKAEDVTGRGAGLTSGALERKIEVIKKSIELHKPDKNDIFDVLSKVGGYDIAALTGAFIGGAMYGAAMVIDGFISSVAALCAEKLCPKCSDFMIASHVSKESCTADILELLGKKAPINADMCLGEGTGGMVMLAALDTALCVYNEMSTFDDINVESYKELK